MSAVAEERLVRQRELALSYRIFAALRWGDLGDGHITARDPEQHDCFWVLRYSVPFERATIDELILVGPDGTIVDGHGPLNTTAYHIHWPIHEARPDVVAAAHTHTHWGTPFSAERRLLQPITQEACAFHDDHALFDDEEVQVLSTDGGKRIAAALGAKRAVILANHGLLTTGAAVGEAVGAFVMMERVCEGLLKAPTARPISGTSARRARDGLGLPGAFADSFEFLVARHVPDPGAVG
ncbi:MAG: class II aldolase/adducin family protein [Acidimicrobiia bacterium]|nr:class II aldolase/adducin family protein [Acidimicrobiia bacterium]